MVNCCIVCVKSLSFAFSLIKGEYNSEFRKYIQQNIYIYILISLMFQKSVVGMQKYEAFEQKYKLAWVFYNNESGVHNSRIWELCWNRLEIYMKL